MRCASMLVVLSGLATACARNPVEVGVIRHSTSTSTGTAGGAGETAEGEDTGLRLDVNVDGDVRGEHPGEPGSCRVNTQDGDATIACSDRAPAGSFEPDVQWTYAPGMHSASTALVANMTDDNGDGEIDLCDVPDVLVSIYLETRAAKLVLLDGATGAVHFEITSETVSGGGTAAIGDVDGDGLPEIVTATLGSFFMIGDEGLAVFEHDGTRKWKRDRTEPGENIALADLDNDGDVEIIFGREVADHEGQTVWIAEDGEVNRGYLPTAADLDGDGDLEVVFGHAAYHHDGSTYYLTPEITQRPRPGGTALPRTSLPSVANLDDDPEPEVLVMGWPGISMLEHDGTIKYQWLTPTSDPFEGDNWNRAATVHDFDGDGEAEFAMNSGLNYSVFEGDGTVVWSATVNEPSGLAAGTAFDFLGDGEAEAVFADETDLFVFDGQGVPIMQVPRASYTAVEYPTVADVDNDGSAEIIVVSNSAEPGERPPAVQVIRDVQDRWIPARRIWNQHTYHVTNVREDGTIPRFEAPHWERLNTFRTQAQIADGGASCRPPPAG